MTQEDHIINHTHIRIDPYTDILMMYYYMTHIETEITIETNT
jgi:hypothetical protein